MIALWITLLLIWNIGLTVYMAALTLGSAGHRKSIEQLHERIRIMETDKVGMTYEDFIKKMDNLWHRQPKCEHCKYRIATSECYPLCEACCRLLNIH